MAILNQICVYCGSGAGEDPTYAESARILGRALAAARIRLVYGGGSVGDVEDAPSATTSPTRRCHWVQDTAKIPAKINMLNTISRDFKGFGMAHLFYGRIAATCSRVRSIVVIFSSV